jgi:dTMP kinase
LAILALAPTLAAVIGRHHITLPNSAVIRADGVTIVLLVSGLLALIVGLFAFRQMDDRQGVSILSELGAGFGIGRVPPLMPGYFVAFEGGEGAGKSTQLRLLERTLRDAGYDDLVVTREPGDTSSGEKIRTLLLDPATRLGSQAEALLYAADRAQHVAEVLRPALRRGAIVLCDRYIDSSLAYQGAGRHVDLRDLERVQRLATGGLDPDLTVILDVNPAVGLARAKSRTGEVDRIEAETVTFHRRVREAFVQRARRNRGRYLVLDAELPPEQLARAIADTVVERLRHRRGASVGKLAERVGAAQ